MKGITKICIIGSNETAKRLIQFLNSSTTIIIIENDEDRLKELQAEFASVNNTENITFIKGEATSAYMLKNLDFEKVFQVLICIENDEATIEIANIIKNHFSHINVTAEVQSQKVYKQLASLGCESVVSSNITANAMINKIDIGSQIAINIGKGEGEIIQVQLTETSPIINKPLKEIKANHQWVVGCIYRPTFKPKRNFLQQYFRKVSVHKNDKLIIPNGTTILKAGDKIILIGDPNTLMSTAEYIRFGSFLFPKKYGPNFIILAINKNIDTKIFLFLENIMQKMNTSDTYVFFRDIAYSNHIQKLDMTEKWLKKEKQDRKSLFSANIINKKNFLKEIKQSITIEQTGLIAILKPKSKFSHFLFQNFILKKLFRHFKKKQKPILIVQNSKPVQEIVFFLEIYKESIAAADLFFDIILALKIPARIIQIIPPRILLDKEDIELGKKSLKQLQNLSTLYGVNTNIETFHGNPIVETLANVKEDSMLVLSYEKKIYYTEIFIPNSTYILTKKFKGNMMILVE